MKNIYLEIKSKYTTDGKYLAVITKNGLWIKDKVDEKPISLIHQRSGKFLINSFITEFDSEYNVLKNIKSKKIDRVMRNGKYMMRKFMKIIFIKMLKFKY